MEINSKKIKHVKIGDRVKILTGAHKGIIGQISRFDKKNLTAIIDGVPARKRNLSKREQQANKELNKTQTEISIDTRIHISNLMLWDSQANLASRIGYQMINGKKTRYFIKSKNLVTSSLPKNSKKKSVEKK